MKNQNQSTDMLVDQSQKNFEFVFESSKSPKVIFDNLLDVRSWWSGIYSEKIKGKSEKINDEFTFSAAGGAHNTTQRLIELIPGEKIVWLVVESNLTFLQNPGEWIGTKISFEISRKGNRSEVRFTHVGLVPRIEAYTGCAAGWTQYLEKLSEKLS